MSSHFSAFRFRRFVSLFAAAFTALAPFYFASAQTSPSTAQQQFVSVSFAIFSMDNDITGLRYDSNGKTSTILVPSSFKPLPVSYNGPTPLVLYRADTGEDGKTVKTPVISIPFPQTTGSFLVLVKEAGGRFHTNVIRDDPSPNSPNSWRFINLSTSRIGFVFPEFKKTLSLAPGQSQEIHLGSLKELGSQDGYSDGVAYLPDPKSRGGWAMAHSTRYLYTPGRPRTVFLLLDPGHPTSVLVKSIDNAVSRKSSSPLNNGANSGQKGSNKNPPPSRRTR